MILKKFLIGLKYKYLRFSLFCKIQVFKYYENIVLSTLTICVCLHTTKQFFLFYCTFNFYNKDLFFRFKHLLVRELIINSNDTFETLLLVLWRNLIIHGISP